ncbi:hypothetical protein DYI37_11755 [Fulvimarina endophytica]|uniref:Uncharacterized protein n=1 Tax=Fulvimarina endophytica TaxID=2293836 RepID=A0A371X392_9HYPH|nr:hypothetical protein [Fulvimarina endophytica]RFC63669.1 hypothetical protein DYI37_11755 [Fulvimarina endophytica]
MTRYVPPKQSRFGQILDVAILLLLTIGALYIPLWLGFAGSTLVGESPQNPTWESLGQNPVMVEQWNGLGFTDASAASEIISSRFNYSFSVIELLVMIVVVIGYYALILRFSEKEYRDVIDEKFNGQ